MLAWSFRGSPWGNGGSSWARGGHPGAMGFILWPGRLTLKCLIWSPECSLWAFLTQPGVMEAHPGPLEVYLLAVKAHPGALEARSGAVEAHPGALHAHLEP